MARRLGLRLGVGGVRRPASPPPASPTDLKCDSDSLAGESPESAAAGGGDSAESDSESHP